jgi:hypothetical protein
MTGRALYFSAPRSVEVRDTSVPDPGPGEVLVAAECSTVDRGPDLTDEALVDWLAERRRQVEAAELVYLIHQIELLGRVDGP